MSVKLNLKGNKHVHKNSYSGSHQKHTNNNSDPNLQSLNSNQFGSYNKRFYVNSSNQDLKFQEGFYNSSRNNSENGFSSNQAQAYSKSRPKNQNFERFRQDSQNLNTSLNTNHPNISQPNISQSSSQHGSLNKNQKSGFSHQTGGFKNQEFREAEFREIVIWNGNGQEGMQEDIFDDYEHPNNYHDNGFDNYGFDGFESRSRLKPSFIKQDGYPQNGLQSGLQNSYPNSHSSFQTKNPQNRSNSRLSPDYIYGGQVGGELLDDYGVSDYNLDSHGLRPEKSYSQRQSQFENPSFSKPKGLFEKTFLGVNYLVIGILVFAILFTSLTGVAVYGQNKILEENEYYKKCQEFLKKEVEKIGKNSVDTGTKPDMECQRKELGWLNFYESGKSRQSYSENLEKAANFEKQVKEVLEKLRQEIITLEGQLNLDSKDLSSLNYQELKTYKEELQKKKTEIDEKNRNLANDIKDDLNILKDQDRQRIEQEIQEIQNKNSSEQENDLKKIQEEVKKLKEEEERTNKERVLQKEMAMYQELSGEGFKSIYQQIEKNYSKTLPESNEDLITGDSEVDARIVQIATSRGYEKRRQAVESELIASDNGQKLQTELAQAFAELKNESKKDGINLVMVSGYRSVDEQRQIFLSRLGSLSMDEIKAGLHDETINNLLKTTAIPGYSRHHTGYTFDIGCDNGQLTIFKNTPCYAWISKNNYLVAKKFGIIPSYPEGASQQGPNPEAWEYVWVGESVLKR